MNIHKLTWRNMIDRPLNTFLSILMLTLGVGIMSLMLHMTKLVEDHFLSNARGVDMVVGAKGSPLQLILSSLYHLDKPTGNISYDEAKKLLKNRLIEDGIPISLGDNYKGFRIMGTQTDYLNLYKAEVVEGRVWEKSFEVVIGADIKRITSLGIGDSFIGSHGLEENGMVHDEHTYKVVGILKKTGTVVDKLILTATESVWDMHSHEHDEEHAHEDDYNHEHEEEHTHEDNHRHEHHEHANQDKEITAMLVQFRNPLAMVQLPRMVNEKTNMQAAIPTYEISRLSNLMNRGTGVTKVISILIIAISGFSIFVSLLTSLKERQYEMALLRSYGSSRLSLVRMVVLEGLLLTVIGFIMGILFSRLCLFIIAHFFLSGFSSEHVVWSWNQKEYWLLGLTFLIGGLAALLPAIRIFKINISKTLADA